jgi:hypothetical protein
LYICVYFSIPNQFLKEDELRTKIGLMLLNSSLLIDFSHVTMNKDSKEIEFIHFEFQNIMIPTSASYVEYYRNLKFKVDAKKKKVNKKKTRF